MQQENHRNQCGNWLRFIYGEDNYGRLKTVMVSLRKRVLMIVNNSQEKASHRKQQSLGNCTQGAPRCIGLQQGYYKRSLRNTTPNQGSRTPHTHTHTSDSKCISEAFSQINISTAMALTGSKDYSLTTWDQDTAYNNSYGSIYGRELCSKDHSRLRIRCGVTSKVYCHMFADATHWARQENMRVYTALISSGGFKHFLYVRHATQNMCNEKHARLLQKHA